MDKYVCVDADYIDDINTIGINKMVNAHTHDYYEIYYFCGDEMTFFLEGIPVALHTHDIVLVNKHIFHKTHYRCLLKKNSRANISFNTGFLHRYFDLESIEKIQKLFDTPLLTNTESNMREKNHHLIISVCDALCDSKKYSMLKGYYNLCILLIEFLQNAEHFLSIPSADEPPSSQNRISQIAKYVNMNYGKNISLASIAQDFYISKFFLSHSFKETLGISITDFINRKRISEAANLLENTNLSLSEVSNAVGFNSQTYFIKTFKHYHKVSPGKYRIIKGSLREYCERVSVEM